jgi:hypothetical protein
VHSGRLNRRTWVTAAIAVGLLAPTNGAAAAPEPTTAATVDPAPAGKPTTPPQVDDVVPLTDATDLVTAIPQVDRDKVLGSDWETSTDRSWTLSGDPSGLHVLVADAADAYQWHTAATLAQPGYDTDQWIGNGCVTASGTRLVVAYAPRSFTNDPELFLQGAWSAVVDLRTGVVTELPVRGSLEYFTPSCGHDEEAVLTISGGEEIAATRLVTVDAAIAQVNAPVEIAGQVTSAILTDSGLVAAVGTDLARIDPAGDVTPLAHARSTPFELAADADGGVVYLDHDGKTSTVRRLDKGRVERPQASLVATALATGPLTDVGDTSTADGSVLVTGRAKASRTMPAHVRLTRATKSAEASVHGDVLVDIRSRKAAAVAENGTVDATAPVTALESTVINGSTGQSVTIDAVVAPEAAPADEGALAAPDGAAPSSDASRAVPSASRSFARDAAPVATVAGALAATPATDRHDPVDEERACAVPRNSVENQALQPKPRQVEWAVNQAVKNVLTVQRPANWKNLGMPAYKPQTMFPPIALSGGGEVPSQILLGILAQESNLWQANSYVVPGVTGSPLIGNYYGIDRHATHEDDLWDPDFISADCGYGVGQVTDGMRRGDTGMPGGRSLDQQRAIALDFAANVAASLQILETKWNQTRNAGLTINDGNPTRIENWYFAIWAYNSGFYPEADKTTDGRNGAWGVGWSNNPANPAYDPSRTFFGADPHDATHPQDWPYPEKVIGFAAFPPSLLEAPNTYVAAYRAAWWPGDGNDASKNRLAAKPDTLTFCGAANQCDYLGTHLPTVHGDANYGRCYHLDSSGIPDGRCWFHGNATWKADCDNKCGRPFLRFVAGYAYQDDGTAYPPACTDAGLPAGALVVDDVPKTAPVVRPGCARPSGDAGTFTLSFSSRTDPTEFPSKMDLHQLGAGYGGHFWFGHTRNSQVRGGSMEFTGTWSLNQPLHQWTSIYVHIPDLGAHTRQATYIVDPGGSRPVQRRVILQRTMLNDWVSLGVFDVDGVPTVTLSTETPDGDYQTDDQGTIDPNDDVQLPAKNEDIAFDAAAFVPLAAKPTDIVVALGDSYSAGEGAGDYYEDSATQPDNPRLNDSCHRSPYTWSRMGVLPGSTLPVGIRADRDDLTLDYHLLACAAAFTTNVNPGGRWLSGEVAQLDRGFLDENTTLVTLSIGGNDAGFTAVLATCFWAGDCSTFLTDDKTMPWHQKVEEDIYYQVGPKVENVLDEIHSKAPNARILLMGYPELFSGRCGGTTSALAPTEVTWLNLVGKVLDDRMALAADHVNVAAGDQVVAFADPRAAFAGKGICGSPQTIHSVEVVPAEGEPFAIGSLESFHPTQEGYAIYGQVMTDALRPQAP